MWEDHIINRLNRGEGGVERKTLNLLTGTP